MTEAELLAMLKGISSSKSEETGIKGREVASVVAPSATTDSAAKDIEKFLVGNPEKEDLNQYW